MTVSLITGIAGFLGSHVARHCLALGHEVVGLDDLSGGFRENVPEGAIFRPGSIAEARDVNALFSLYKPDYVYHLAAYAAEGLSHHIRAFNYANNLVGSANVINAAVKYGARHFVFASSAAVYGHFAHGYDEDQTPHPIDPYGVAKYAVEMDLKAAGYYFGLTYTIFRLHNVYGERQNLSDLHRNVVAIFMRQCLQGLPMTIFGNGHQARAFTYVDDVAPIMGKAPIAPLAKNMIFNAGSDYPVTVIELAQAVADAVGVEIRINYLPPREEAASVAPMHTKLGMAFGSTGITPLSVGLEKMAAWARTQQLREPKPFAAIEIERGLPKAWRQLATKE